MSGKIGFKFRCDMCGEELIRTRINQKYCDDCSRHYLPKYAEPKTQYERNKEYRERWYSKPEAEKSAKPTYTLTEVCAAARKHNMSYGQYMAAWNFGRVPDPEHIEAKKKKRGRPCKST